MPGVGCEACMTRIAAVQSRRLVVDQVAHAQRLAALDACLARRASCDNIVLLLSASTGTRQLQPKQPLPDQVRFSQGHSNQDAALLLLFFNHFYYQYYKCQN